MQKRIRLAIILSMILMLYVQVYPVTIFNTADYVVVIYKILDPLTVTVDPTEKLIVSATNMEPFKYSLTSPQKKPINIKVERPFNQRDDILDAVFSKATLEIQDSGKFDLMEIKDKTKIIGGRGYFISNNDYKITIPLKFGGGVRNYQGDTNLDVEFNGEKKKMEMGTYKGVMRIDVTYGG